MASISSSDSNFTATDARGTIRFKAAGGSVTVNVDCGTEWTVENPSSDLFPTTVNYSDGTVTVSAVQNPTESERSSTITLLTASQRISFATVTAVQSAYGAPELTLDTTEWNFPAKGDLSVEIGVECSLDDYEVTVSDSWLNYVKTDTGFTLSAQDNEDPVDRSATVSVKASDGVSAQSAQINVTQDARASITFSRPSIVLSSFGDSDSMTVESNYDGITVSYDSSADWFTFGFDGKNVTVSAAEYTGSDARSVDVTFSSGDGADNVIDQVYSFVQTGTGTLYLVYNIPEDGAELRLPLSGTVSCTVDWGDGSEAQYVTSTLPTHTYASAGEYNVLVDGVVTTLQNYSESTSTIYSTYIKAVKQWGTTGLRSMARAFQGCAGLESIPTDNAGSFNLVASWAYTFYGCSSLKEIPAGLFDNCTITTSLLGTFCQSGITKLPAGIFDKCTNVTTLNRLFFGCSALEEISEGIFDNMPNVTNCYGVLYCCGIKSIPNGLFKGMDKVTTFEYAASFCPNLTSVGDEVFSGCSSVTSFQYLFYNCPGLQTIGKDIFAGCTAVTNISWAFRENDFEQLSSDLFKDMENVTDASYLLFGNTKLKSLPSGLFDSFGKVTKFDDAFYGCTGLETIASDLFNSCVSCTSFKAAFYNCSSLKEIPKGLFDKTTAVTDFYGVFYGCSSLTEIPAGLFDNCPSVTSYYAAFYNCTSLTTIHSGLFDSGTLVENFGYIFYNCSSLTEIPKGLFDNCTKVTTFQAAFYQCSTLTTVPDGLFQNCPEVTSFSFLFRSAGLTSVPANLFANCNKIEALNAAFLYCYNLSGESPYTELADGTKVHLYERTADMGTVPDGTNCFGYCFHLTDYADIPTSWGGPTGTSSTSSLRQSLTSTSFALDESELRPASAFDI